MMTFFDVALLALLVIELFALLTVLVLYILCH
jgi:hypothetical protein